MSAQFDDVYVRQFAAIEPTSSLGAEEGQNTAPVAADDAYSATIDTALNVPAPGVLTNDTDADSNPLTAVKVSDPANGALTLNADGSFTYTPNAGFTGSDSFSYTANDGTVDSASATVTVTVSDPSDPCTSPANDIVAENCLTGNPSSEWDISGAGDASIQGFATDISVNKGDTMQFQD